MFFRIVSGGTPFMNIHDGYTGIPIGLNGG